MKIDGRVRFIRSQVSRVSRKRHHFQSVTQLSGPVGAFVAGLSERYRIFAVSVVNIICKLVKVRDVQSVVLTKNNIIMQDSVPNVICKFSHYFG